MEVTVIFGKVAGVFIMVLLGYVTNKIGWLPLESSKYLSKIVINIAAPCAVFYSMCTKEMEEGAFWSVIVLLLGVTGLYFLAALLSVAVTKLQRVQKKNRGVFANFMIFPNNGFMGFPVCLAVFGADGLFYMVLSNVSSIVLLFTLAIYFVKKDRNVETREKPARVPLGARLKSICSFPLVSALVSLAFFLLQIPVHEGVLEVFSSVGTMMTPLSMIVIGLQLTESNFRAVILDRSLTLMCLWRLVLIAGLVFLILMPFEIAPLIRCVIVLNFALPCASVPVALAEEHGADAKFAAEGAFLSILFSMVSLPIACVLLTLYVL
ncbi:MAG: AEC family transporter [Clostridiales Family XIII bacterium]|jgi:predicted permease|nr:AEC family transporter [Clostridiales Family XIII bacterium]